MIKLKIDRVWFAMESRFFYETATHQMANPRSGHTMAPHKLMGLTMTDVSITIGSIYLFLLKDFFMKV